MKDDVVMRLLREVKAGKVSVEDARVALEDASLTEESFEAAVNHGVFNEVKPGTIVRASLAPSGDSWLIIIVGLWGILWTLYWAGALAYGLYQEWDQQLLAFNLAMTLLTQVQMSSRRPIVLSRHSLQHCFDGDLELHKTDNSEIG